MNIYKLVANYGLDTELDSCIYHVKEVAEKNAELWLKDEECDSVDIYEECPDYETGTFRTLSRVFHKDNSSNN